MSIENKQLEEIKKLMYKFNYDEDCDKIFYRICYNNESKNIKTIKYLVEQSKRLQWWYIYDYCNFCKKTIVININPSKF